MESVPPRYSPDLKKLAFYLYPIVTSLYIRVLSLFCRAWEQTQKNHHPMPIRPFTNLNIRGNSPLFLLRSIMQKASH